MSFEGEEVRGLERWRELERPEILEWF